MVDQKIRKRIHFDKKNVVNMLKSFMDALAGVVYVNDNCIVDARVSKAYRTLQTTNTALLGGLRSVFPAFSRRSDEF
jgi:Holliday junction resolvase RusA-like endonuclease